MAAITSRKDPFNLKAGPEEHLEPKWLIVEPYRLQIGHPRSIWSGVDAVSGSGIIRIFGFGDEGLGSKKIDPTRYVVLDLVVPANQIPDFLQRIAIQLPNLPQAQKPFDARAPKKYSYRRVTKLGCQGASRVALTRNAEDYEFTVHYPQTIITEFKKPMMTADQCRIVTTFPKRKKAEPPVEPSNAKKPRLSP